MSNEPKYPDRPGPPREVHEDAAARERIELIGRMRSVLERFAKHADITCDWVSVRVSDCQDARAVLDDITAAFRAHTTAQEAQTSDASSEEEWRPIEKWPEGLDDPRKCFLVWCPDNLCPYAVINENAVVDELGTLLLWGTSYEDEEITERVTMYRSMPAPPTQRGSDD